MIANIASNDALILSQRANPADRIFGNEPRWIAFGQ
jgi:hypothetical protein